jgi:hypothetical protein
MGVPPFGGRALSDVPTRDLELLLLRVYRGEVRCPLSHQSLVLGGLPHLVDRVGFLHGHDARTVQAVLVAVIAERRAMERRAKEGVTHDPCSNAEEPR